MKFPFCIIFLCYSILIFSCGKSDALRGASEASNISIEILSKELDLGIVAPDHFGGGIRNTFIFKDTLAYVIPSKPLDIIFIVDLKNKTFIDEIPLDPNFITSPSGVQVISEDSIFVSDMHFPFILLINSQGEIRDSYNLFRENLWEMPAEGFANFGLYFGFGDTFRYLPEKRSFLVPLRQIDQWFFVNEKKSFPAIGEYNIDKKEFVNLFGKYKGVYASDRNTLLPFYLSHPTVEIVDEYIYLCFAVDPYIYKYDFKGDLIQTKVATIPEFELGEPLEYNMEDFDEQGLRDYNKSNSYFGNFFFVKEQNCYVRIFFECVKNAHGKCSSKKVHALIFDKDLNLLEVKTLEEEYGGEDFTFQIAYKNGFLSKLGKLNNDDEFIINSYYSLNK
ncbi:DUF4221 family protein [Algoriphagus halophytocola]|uniref:DUF4221 family protein n=1 Tax=Algoriphagus halophytocola TaxID=2991499 RepID=UPI0022DDE2A9|nr:DUF4221 family protein [Algoriphagus sp. TR-M9]WBL43833.1 DUF4221 family protein [Algoriphagus sp. TR-M9]